MADFTINPGNSIYRHGREWYPGQESALEKAGFPADQKKRKAAIGTITVRDEPGKKTAAKAKATSPQPTSSPDAGDDEKYRVVPGAPGWFDVVGPDGEAVNEKALREEAAEKLAAEKNGGE